jgi:hypothetical protein
MKVSPQASQNDGLVLCAHLSSQALFCMADEMFLDGVWLDASETRLLESQGPLIDPSCSSRP